MIEGADSVIFMKEAIVKVRGVVRVTWPASALLDSWYIGWCWWQCESSPSETSHQRDGGTTSSAHHHYRSVGHVTDTTRSWIAR
jgi:hypothetical protein